MPRETSPTRRLLHALLLLLGLLTAAPAFARSCADLARETLPDGRVTAATEVAAGAFQPPASPFPLPPGVAPTSYAGLPAFCRVELTLTPTPDSDIRAEVWLPAAGWNGKFVGIGNGIWAGTISYAEMGTPLTRGYAVASTDTGHVGNGLTADFAVGHPEKLVDFGHRAVHLMTVRAKAMAAAFYGRAPATSIWTACSTGGRQGLMEAYRYPADYDAISAMAPANPMTDLMTQTMWTGFQPLKTPASALPPPTLAALHAAYLAQCDLSDGLKDGLVADPRACAFNPAVAACAGAAAPTCLTPPQLAAIRAIYAGVPAGAGSSALPGFPPGSELQLPVVTSGPEPFPVATSYMRLIVFGDKHWDFRSFDYARDPARARAMGAAILDVPAAGLRPFFARGGKLLMSHGWDDGLIPANNTLAFEAALRSAIPAGQATRQFRLFMVPGMQHCGGGDGPFRFDVLDIADRWAATGTPPDRIVASNPPGKPALSRPLCPFPQAAHYAGKGDPAEAASFTCSAS